MWRMTLATVASLATSSLSYTSLPPLMLVGLASPDSEHVARLLKQLHRMWEILCKMEKDALNNVEIHRFLRNLRWPLEQLSREIFVLLSESEFDSVPPWVLGDVTCFGMGFNSTLIIENAFNGLRRLERKTLSGQLGPLIAWHGTCHSQLPNDFD